MEFHTSVSVNASVTSVNQALQILNLHFLGSDLSGSFGLLHEAEMTLKNIVKEKFDAAILKGDRNAVERYFMYELVEDQAS